MKSYLAIIVTALSSCITTHLFAGNETKIKQDLLDALAAEYLKTVEVAASFAKEELSVLDDSTKLLSELKKGKPGQPVSELMTVEQATNFGALSQKHKYYFACLLMNSRRERDLKVLEELIVLAANEFEWNKRLEESTKDERIHGIFYVIDSELIKNTEEMDAVPRVNDKVEAGIDSLRSSVMDDVKHRIGPSSIQFLENFTKRTGLSEVKNELLTPEEKKEQDSNMHELRRNLKYVMRLSALRCLYSAMTIDNKWRMEDVVTTSGNVDKVGLRLGTEVSAKWNPTAKLVMGIAWFIADKFPTTFVEEYEEVEKAVGK